MISGARWDFWFSPVQNYVYRRDFCLIFNAENSPNCWFSKQSSVGSIFSTWFLTTAPPLSKTRLRITRLEFTQVNQTSWHNYIYWALEKTQDDQGVPCILRIKLKEHVTMNKYKTQLKCESTTADGTGTCERLCDHARAGNSNHERSSLHLPQVA